MAVSLFTAACSTGGGTTPDAEGGDPIKVGILATTTGDLSVFGIAEKQGIDVALADIAAEGGIDGRPVEAIYYDPAGDTAKAVEQVNRMIQQDEVDVILDASASSGVGLAVKPVAEAAGIVMVTAGAAAGLTSPASESPLTFGTTLSTDIVAQKMLAFIGSEGVEKLGLLSSSDGFGKAGAASLVTAATAAGIEVQAIEYDAAATDLTTQLRELQAGGNQAFVNWTSGATAAVFFRNAADVDLAADGPVMASFTFSNPALMEQAGPDADGIIVAGIKATLLSELPDSDPEKAVIQAFNDELESEYGVPVTIYAAQAHDMVLVIKAAIESAGTTDGEALAAAIEELQVDGVQGTYRFTANDHRGLSTNNLSMMQWSDGKFVPVGD